MRTKSEAARWSASKGAAFEREVAAAIAHVTGRHVIRNTLERVTGNNGDLIVDLPITVQCKVGLTPPVWEAIAESIEVGARQNKHPVAILRRNAKVGRPKQDVAVMPLDVFLELLGLLAGRGIW